MDTYKKTSVMDDTNPANRDPLTKEPGSHPVGTGIGSAGGAAAGAAIGAVVGGPIGAVVGGVVGAVSGGAAGHAAGEAVNPTVEDAYWRENYKARPYYRAGRTYGDYQPAYKYGWESASRPEYRGRKFSDVEKDLKAGWTSDDATSTWADNREAAQDAWSRVDGL
jgi:phage tail tape-measure protein